MGLCVVHYENVPHGYVDATEAIERYQILRGRGLTTAEIARLSGVHRDTLRQMGTWTDGGNVRRETHDRIMAVRIPRAIQASRVHINAVGTHRRIRAMTVAGHSLRLQGERMGVTQQAMTALLSKQSVAAETAAKVARLFDELKGTEGTSKRARDYALRRGWLPEIVWEDIDNPNEVPDSGERRVPFIERYEEYRHLGKTDEQIAAALGMKLQSLKAALMREKRRAA